MKDTMEMILIFVFIAAACFVFDGDPDLWDKWHAEAMKTECSVEKR